MPNMPVDTALEEVLREAMTEIGRGEKRGRGKHEARERSILQRLVEGLRRLTVRCAACGWEFVILTAHDYGAGVEWNCPHCSKGVRA